MRAMGRKEEGGIYVNSDTHVNKRVTISKFESNTRVAVPYVCVELCIKIESNISIWTFTALITVR